MAHRFKDESRALSATWPNENTPDGLYGPVTISQPPDVCDTCLDAAYDSGAPDNKVDQAICAMEMGDCTDDHTCQAREDGEPCGCACRNS